MILEGVVNRVIAEKLLLEQVLVIPGARLVEDLGADSLNILEVVLDLNEIFEIELSAHSLECVRRVGDLYLLVGNAMAARPD